MSNQSARHLLRDYCKPANYTELVFALAEEKGIQESELHTVIDSGEFVLDGKWIRRNPIFKPSIAIKHGVDKQDLLTAVDTAHVFSNELDQPIKDAKWQSVKCPFHEDNNPSLRILLPDGGFECKGCGERGGNVIDFTMKLHRLDFPTAIQYLATNYTTIRQ